MATHIGYHKFSFMILMIVTWLVFFPKIFSDPILCIIFTYRCIELRYNVNINMSMSLMAATTQMIGHQEKKQDLNCIKISYITHTICTLFLFVQVWCLSIFIKGNRFIDRNCVWVLECLFFVSNFIDITACYGSTWTHSANCSLIFIVSFSMI